MACCCSSVDGEVEYVGAVEIPKGAGVTNEKRLEAALKAELQFYGVDLAKFNPDEHTNCMKDVTKENLKRIAEVLKENPKTCIKICGYCGPPVHGRALKLSLQRTRMARKFLQDLGCTNSMAAYPMGYIVQDLGGPRCETGVCTAEQVVHFEAEVELMFIQELPITFYDPEDESKEHRVVFCHSPLGLRFRVGMAPITLIMVDKNSAAEKLGCKPGWKVKEINDRNVMKFGYEETYHRIIVGSKTLKLNAQGNGLN